MPTTYAIDWEGYYDDDCGIKSCGVQNYLYHEKFDPYLLSVHTDDWHWCGPTKEFDWARIDYDNAEFVSHNAGFDLLVWQRAQELRIVPSFCFPKQGWFCTANMSTFLGGPRNLLEASLHMLGVEVSKEMRNYMKGKTWQQAIDAGKADELIAYAASDSEQCYKLWKKYSHLWPEVERKTAWITFLQTQRGVYIDREKVTKAIPGIKLALETAYEAIPWAGSVDENGDEVKPTSAIAFKKWCKQNGVPPPETTEAKNQDFVKWQEDHPEVECVKAMQTYRSANAFLKKVETLLAHTRPDGQYNFAMLYYGATTGRWSAGYEDDKNDSLGFNIQNIVKGEHYGLDLRSCILPHPGKKFVIADFSQIEPRCLSWLVNDTVILKELQTGISYYEAHARTNMGWKGGNLKKQGGRLYDLAKARVLALGYGAGWQKLLVMCATFGIPLSIFDDPITTTERNDFVRYLRRTRQFQKTEEFRGEQDWIRAVNAWKVVLDWRSRNELITDFWRLLETDAKRSVGGEHDIVLPSDRMLRYFDVRLDGGLSLRKTLHAKRIGVWGGFFCENVCQAMARDVMRDAIIALEDALIATLFTVHDEIICEVDLDFDLKTIADIMTRPPTWAPDLPLAIDIKESDHYLK